MSEILVKGTSADVMLLLEGTFPYVSGGVSSWVNQMIRAFPDLRFGIVFIGSRREDYGDMAYQLPPNVVHLETHYLYDFPPPPLVQGSLAMPRSTPRTACTNCCATRAARPIA